MTGLPLSICFPPIFVWHRRDRQLAGAVIGDQFESADVAAVDASRLWAIAIMPDLDLARGTLPRHTAEIVNGFPLIELGCEARGFWSLRLGPQMPARVAAVVVIGRAARARV